MSVRCLEYIANPIDKTSVGLIRIIASQLNWVLLYFMVFEMMYINAKIKSENVHQLKMTRKRISNIRLGMFALYILFYTIPSILIYDPILEIGDDFYKALLIIRACTKLPIDVYMFYTFISLF